MKYNCKGFFRSLFAEEKKMLNSLSPFCLRGQQSARLGNEVWWVQVWVALTLDSSLEIGQA